MRLAIACLITFIAGHLQGCGDAELTSYQESLIERCIRAAIGGVIRSECNDVTVAMERAFIEKHPGFREKASAEMLAEEAAHNEFMANLEAKRRASEREKRLASCASAARYVAGECALGSRKCRPVNDFDRQEVGRKCKDFSESEIADALEAVRQAESAKKADEHAAQERAAAAARSSPR
jgi:hypothetical protein